MSQRGWISSRGGWSWGAWLLLLGCTAPVESGRAGDASLPRGVAQRVTATVQREALHLVRLETERESLLTTPEHPFATPGSGWIRAGRLLPGARVLSERFGAVRILSVRGEVAARPVPVFNLSVASSHAYFVGTGGVLVHNTKCKPGASEAREKEIERLSRERSQDERALQHFSADHESTRHALEAVHKELAELESQAPLSEAEKLARQEELKKQRSALQLRYERTGRIATWLAELVALDKDTPATNADRRTLEERKEALRESLHVERKREADWRSVRNKRADWDGREDERRQDRRRHRTAAYVADRERPRDRLELLEEELSRRLEEAPSARRDARVRQVTAQMETMQRLVELRREIGQVNQKRTRARVRRAQRIADGQDTSEIDRELERALGELDAIRVEHAQLRKRERLLARVGGAPSAHAWGSAVRAEADEVDAVLSEREALMGQGASPERAAGFESSSERLERELREERAAVEGAVFALLNESAHIQTTRAGSSSGPSWQERLRGIQEERERLTAQWRASLQVRVDSARQRLRVRRSVFALRDEAIEAELVREITLLERELQRAGG